MEANKTEHKYPTAWVRAEILAKPKEERTIADVKRWLDVTEADRRKIYESVAANSKLSGTKEEEHDYDSWSEADDAKKALAGQAPISKVIDYFSKKSISLKSEKREFDEDMNIEGLFGNKTRKSDLSEILSLMDDEVSFYDQAIDLIRKDWELRRTYSPEVGDSQEQTEVGSQS